MVVLRQSDSYILNKGTGNFATLYNVIRRADKAKSAWFSGDEKAKLLRLNETDFDEICKKMIDGIS